MEEFGLQTSELARLVVAIIVLPAIAVVGRRARGESGAWPYPAMIAAVYISYVFTLIEEFWFEEFFDALQHVSLAAAGVFALMAALHTRRVMHRDEF